MNITKWTDLKQSQAWRAVAKEMLAGKEEGAQVGRPEAWRRACKEILDLRFQVANLNDQIDEERLEGYAAESYRGLP